VDYDDDDGEDEAIDVANANSDDELPSDEECDVYVLEPHEAVYFQRLREEKERRASENCAALRGTREEEKAINDESGSDFLSPADDGGGGGFERLSDAGRCHGTSSDWRREEEERKRRALLPMVNGRPAVVASYNSFRRYRDVVSAGGSAKAAIEKRREEEEGLEGEGGGTSTPSSSAGKTAGGEDGRPDDVYKSRILGAALAQSDPAGFSSEMTAEDDDGEGWVTCARDIIAMKATGSLDPAVGPSSSSALRDDRRRSDADAGARDRKIFGPPIHQRAACATTDFAMQNVILQMNLELVAVDGARVRRLKTWVARCGACFTVYAGDKQEKAGGRLFCDRCGSNMMQRIACSVDRGTGRLKLHMKRNYCVNTRGTKFSLPKPGKVRQTCANDDRWVVMVTMVPFLVAS
jgi:RNA-binding protein NOB1